jgi:hypothetical protein
LAQAVPEASSDEPNSPLDSARPIRVGFPIYLGVVPVVLLAGYLIARRLGNPAEPLAEREDEQGHEDGLGNAPDG